MSDGQAVFPLSPDPLHSTQNRTDPHKSQRCLVFHSWQQKFPVQFALTHRERRSQCADGPGCGPCWHLAVQQRYITARNDVLHGHDGKEHLYKEQERLLPGCDCTSVWALKPNIIYYALQCLFLQKWKSVSCFLMSCWEKLHLKVMFKNSRSWFEWIYSFQLYIDAHHPTHLDYKTLINSRAFGHCIPAGALEGLLLWRQQPDWLFGESSIVWRRGPHLLWKCNYKMLCTCQTDDRSLLGNSGGGLPLKYSLFCPVFRVRKVSKLFSLLLITCWNKFLLLFYPF